MISVVLFPLASEPASMNFSILKLVYRCSPALFFSRIKTYSVFARNFTKLFALYWLRSLTVCFVLFVFFFLCFYFKTELNKLNQAKHITETPPTTPPLKQR